MNVKDIYSLFQKTKGVVTDTRLSVKNSFYIALKGINFDGNNFAKEAIEKAGGKVVVADAAESAKPAKKAKAEAEPAPKKAAAKKPAKKAKAEEEKTEAPADEAPASEEKSDDE